jgi:hypothetical protein
LGVEQEAGVWFGEPVREMTIFAEQYDFTVTLLLLEDGSGFARFGAKWRGEGMTNAPRKVSGWTPKGIVLFAIALERHRLGSTEPRLSKWGWWPAECNKVASTRFCGNMELRIDDSGAVEWFVQRNSDN